MRDYCNISCPGCELIESSKASANIQHFHLRSSPSQYIQEMGQQTILAITMLKNWAKTTLEFLQAL